MESGKSLNKVYALVLAGGAGSRFWPFSRELEPKQFMNLIGKHSLLQDTVSRLHPVVRPENIFIVSNASYFFELKRQLARFNIPEDNIILEPQAKNTAPAIGLCAKFISGIDKDAILIVLPSDHFIRNTAKFRACLLEALRPAAEGFLVTIGIKPRNPSTGYGYIKVKPRNINEGASYFKVDKFLEKPGLELAKKYVKNRKYFWNSGIFIWKVSVFMRELEAYLPDLYSILARIDTKEDIAKVWGKIKGVSVDYGIMEHSGKIALIPASFDWSDLGSWDALNDVLPKEARGNIIQTDSLDCESSGISVFSRSNRLIGTVGLKDLIIADTADALLVCAKDKAQDVKKIVDKLKESDRKEHKIHLTDRRPWGQYTVLFGSGNFKIKLVEIEPKKRLSLQSHSRRAEHWVVVSGCAKVTRGNSVRFVKSNQSIYIPKGIKHRLENPTDVKLQIVEVQTGNYLEEDDIRRFQDDFQR